MASSDGVELERTEVGNLETRNSGTHGNVVTSEGEGCDSKHTGTYSDASDPVTGKAHVLSLQEFQNVLTHQNGGSGVNTGNTETDKKKRLGGSWRCGVGLTIGLLVAIVLVVVLGVGAGSHGDWYGEPGSYRHAVVVTDNGICSSMGRNILEKGGSAVDGAITAQLCLGLVHSQSSGLGGGFFMVVYKAEDGISKFLDAREMAPSAANEAYATSQRLAASPYGINLTAVPGEVLGLWNAHQMYGNLPWRDLFTPVIELAENGYTVTEHLDETLQSMADTQPLSQYPGVWDIYMKDDGSPKRKGDKVYNLALAGTLKAIAQNGTDEFYRGETARKLVDEIQSLGGIMNMADLNGYHTRWSPVLSSQFGNFTLLAPSLPSGGPVLQFIIQVMQAFNLTKSDFDTNTKRVRTYHRFIEASKFAFALRSHLGDVTSAEVNRTLSVLTSVEMARDIAASIPKDSVTYTNVSYYDVAREVTSSLGGTSHVSVLAANGDAVSLTSSINYRFGNRVRSSTGIVYNNEMADFSLSPSSPNFVRPGTRPLSSMSGNIVLGRDGHVKMVEGSAGSKRIITSNAWIILSVLFGEVPLSTVIDEPKIHCQLNPQVYIDYEADFPVEILHGLEALGHSLTETKYYSVIEAILRQGDVIHAYSDPRKPSGKPSGY